MKLYNFILVENKIVHVDKNGYTISSGRDFILMIGCGGGYDIYVGLPLYFELNKRGVQIKLVNFSFTSIENLSLFNKLEEDKFEVGFFPRIPFITEIGSTSLCDSICGHSDKLTEEL